LEDKHAPSPVAALANENPVTLMAQLRNVWPEVEKAIRVGHTLRVIHRRLNQMGIPITYRRLTVYRGRLQREKGTRGLSAVVAETESSRAPIPNTFDPLFNMRQQEKKRVTWQYPTGPPDESKLI
jgi:hypothetical protein